MNNTLGVLGGGQLGMMFTHAAQRRGFRVAVLDPDADAPAMRSADDSVVAAYDDPRGWAALAEKCIAVTTEFENVPAASLEWLATRVTVSPPATAVAIAQDRRREKAFFTTHRFPVGAHTIIARSDADVSNITFPAILKTATLGYDGKGQVFVPSAQMLDAAWAQLNRVPCVLEQKIDLALEVSVIVARNRAGETAVLPIQENQHRNGILDITIVPARIDETLRTRATGLATEVVAALGYVGVLCIELFISQRGELLVNEIAPRPHNSGHYSIEACEVSQFDLQVLAMTDAPLPASQLRSPAVMVNVLGDCWHAGEPDWDAVRKIPGVHVHLYGKREAKPGRKMGHVTCLGMTVTNALATAQHVKTVLGIPA